MGASPRSYQAFFCFNENSTALCSGKNLASLRFFALLWSYRSFASLLRASVDNCFQPDKIENKKKQKLTFLLLYWIHEQQEWSLLFSLRLS